MPPTTAWTFNHFSASLAIFRNGLVMLLAVALLGTEAVPAFAKEPQTFDPSTVESQVKMFGEGKSVKIWLVGGEMLSGHIRSIGEDSFTVKINRHSERSIPYAQVTYIKDPSPLMWLLIGAAIVLVTVLIVEH